LSIELPVTKDFHLNSQIKRKFCINSSSNKNFYKSTDGTWTKDTKTQNQHVSPFIIHATTPHVGTLCELTFIGNSQQAVTESYPN